MTLIGSQHEIAFREVSLWAFFLPEKWVLTNGISPCYQTCQENCSVFFFLQSCLHPKAGLAYISNLHCQGIGHCWENEIEERKKNHDGSDHGENEIKWES